MTRRVQREGEYRYLHNGNPAPVQEYWRIESLAGGELDISSHRLSSGIEIGVSARQRAGLVHRCRVEWRSARGAVAVEYEHTAAGLRYRRDDAAAWECLDTAVDGPVTLYPLMRVFTGPVITALAAQGGEGRVLVPAVDDPEDLRSLLHPTLSKRRVRLLEAGSGDACWQFVGGQYDEHARFWLSRDGLLSRYRWHQEGSGEWDVSLVT